MTKRVANAPTKNIPDEPVAYYRFRNEIPTHGYTWIEDWEPVPLELGGAIREAPPYMARSGDLLPNRHMEVRSDFPLREKPGLHRTFAELHDEPDAMLEFANEHGWLMGSDRVIHPPSGRVISVLSESVWKKEIREMKIACHFWDCVRDDDRRELRKYIVWAKDFYGVRFSIGVSPVGFHSLPDAWATKGLPPKTSKQGAWLVHSVREQAEMKYFGPNDGWNKGDVLGPARLVVVKLVNARLATHCHPCLYLGDDGNPVGLLTPNNLLGCLWLQLYQEVTGLGKLAQCAICRKIMDVSRNRSHKKVHDACSKRERQKRYREKRAYSARCR